MRAEGQIWPAERNVVVCVKLNKISGITIEISEIHDERIVFILFLPRISKICFSMISERLIRLSTIPNF